MPVGVIHMLEMIKVKEDHAEFIAKAGGAIDLSFQCLVKMAGVVEAGAIVSDCQFLDLLHGAGVINGDGSVIAKSMQEEHLLLPKTFHGAVDELDHAQNAVLRLQGHADD